MAEAPNLDKPMSELSIEETPISDTPNKDLTRGETSSSGNPPPPPPPPLDKGKGKEMAIEEYYFSFSVMPGSKLKHSIGSLSETDINPTGMARIDVSEAGFEVTVRDYHPQEGEPIEVTGFLSLKATGLIDFKCKERFSKMINLDAIAKFLDTVDDRDTVRVFSVDGNVLSVEFFKISRTGVPQRHSVETSFSDVSLLKRFPTVSCGFEQAIPSDKMRPLLTSLMADLFDGKLPRLGQACIEQTVRIKAGPSEVKVVDEQYMWFVMTNWFALKKASRLTDTCLFYLVNRPVEHILLRFSLKELGDFFILKTAQACLVHRQPKILPTFGPHT